jgi:hypothetical protein
MGSVTNPYYTQTGVLPPSTGSAYGSPVSPELRTAINSVSASAAPKPFDWKGAGDALGGLMGGVGNLIRGIRGEAPIPMAGMGLGKYLQENDQDSFLTDLISSIITKTQAESDPILRSSTKDKDNWEIPPYPTGTFPKGNI